MTKLLLAGALIILAIIKSSLALAEPDPDQLIVFQSCHSGAPVIELWWRPRSDATMQVIDLSYVDNAFQSGTFRQEGPFVPGQSSLVWQGLRAATNHFARVAWILSDGSWTA